MNLQAAATGTDARETRALPSAIGPEKSVLSSCMVDTREYVGRAVEAGVTEETFYMPGHGLLWGQFVELYNAGQVVELVSFIQRLSDKGLLDNVGGPQAVYDLFTYAPHAGHFDNHLAIVRDKATLRRVIRTCTEAIAKAHEADDVAALVDATEAAVLAIRAGNETATEDTGIVAAVEEWISDIEDEMRGTPKVRGISTPFPSLTRMTGGFKPGDFVLVAARPGQGKSALMGNLVEHIAIECQIPCLVFSMEMTKRQLVSRAGASRARFDVQQIRDGEMPNKAELLRIKRAVEELKVAPIHIDDRAGLSIEAIRAKSRRLYRDKGIRIVFIDYLQLAKGTTKQAQFSREREVAEFSAGGKGLAKELGIPVVALAQLNRKPEDRTGKNEKVGRPKMSDLRDSGSLEQDADKIMLLYPVGENEDPPDMAVDLLLDKNREGPTGVIQLTFIKEISRFEERARDYDAETVPPPPRSRWDKNS